MVKGMNKDERAQKKEAKEGKEKLEREREGINFLLKLDTGVHFYGDT